MFIETFSYILYVLSFITVNDTNSVSCVKETTFFWQAVVNCLLAYSKTLKLFLFHRNCLVGHHYQIKISDLGRDRELYQQDYCRPMGAIDPIPLRWMAWESVFLVSLSLVLIIFNVDNFRTLTPAKLTCGLLPCFFGKF